MRPRERGRHDLLRCPDTARLVKKVSAKAQRDTSWWDVWPGLYKREIEAFESLGVPFTIKLKKKGLLLLDVDWPIEGQDSIQLSVGFSPMHPFCRPGVAAPENSFERHQHPLSGDLCLLTQEFHQWNSLQLVADFIDERLRQFHAALKARHEKRWKDAAELEEGVADPFMPYFKGVCEDSSVILFNGQMSLPRESFGIMDIATWDRDYKAEYGQSFEALIKSLKTINGRSIDNFKLPRQPAGERLTIGRWIRLDRPPLTDNPEAFLALVESEFTALRAMQPRAIDKLNEVSSGSFSITGVVFPEEVRYGQGRVGVGWIFIVSRRKFKDGILESPLISLARGERVGEEEVFSRLPVASSLRSKKVFLVGCGAIGSFVAVELARAGVKSLDILDRDVVEPGNSLRWPLGRPAWGVKKPVALANFIMQNYPWSEVTPYIGNVGQTVTNQKNIATNFASDPAPLDQIRTLIAEADIVIDATASTEVQHTLAYHCRELNKPFILGYATEGLAGGIVARFQPDSNICWVCVNEHWEDETLQKLRVDPTGVITPVGCNNPTFTGGGFDLQEISLEIVRSAVGVLSNGTYEPGRWSVAILELLDDDGQRILPRWSEHSPLPHARCCGSAL